MADEFVSAVASQTESELASVEVDMSSHDAEYKEALTRVSGEVLETMFFSEVVPAECEHSWLVSAVAVQVCFDGTHWGDMWLAVGEEAVPELASAFLGLDPSEASEMERAQVMLELANILCGAILSSLWPESSLQLEPPKQAPWTCNDTGVWHCCLMLPEGRLAISVQLRGMRESA
jgi:CheY-specific phosphatase CheX